jgi:hypothetical protein
MNQSLATVIGMSIAYFFSFMGLILAWYSYRKHQREGKES